MACSGSREIGVRGGASRSYQGLRFGISSLNANSNARSAAYDDAVAKIAAETATICTGLCEKGCDCVVTSFKNPTAYNNPSTSWYASATGWFGLSIAGVWTVTYAYIVKAECVDPPH